MYLKGLMMAIHGHLSVIIPRMKEKTNMEMKEGLLTNLIFISKHLNLKTYRTIKRLKNLQLNQYFKHLDTV